MTPNEIAHITSKLYICDHLPPKADLGIWHGSSYVEGVAVLGNLYNEGKVSYILVTGGNNPNLGDIEAIRARAILLEMGVPCERIIHECNSSNTRENIDFSMRILKVRLGLKSLTSIIVCTIWWHMRRAIMTNALPLLPSTRFCPLNVFSPKSSLENWHINPDVRGKVVAEIDKIEKYMAKGDLAPVVRYPSGYFMRDVDSAISA